MVVPTLRGAALKVSGSEVESQPLWLLLTLARWIEPTEAGQLAVQVATSPKRTVPPGASAVVDGPLYTNSLAGSPYCAEMVMVAGDDEVLVAPVTVPVPLARK